MSRRNYSPVLAALARWSDLAQEPDNEPAAMLFRKRQATESNSWASEHS
jgi:hypothetical protein